MYNTIKVKSMSNADKDAVWSNIIENNPRKIAFTNHEMFFTTTVTTIQRL